VIFCGLMVIYSDAISWAFVRGLEIGCGCGLADPAEKITWLTVVRDLLFLTLGLAVLFALPLIFPSDQKNPLVSRVKNSK